MSLGHDARMSENAIALVESEDGVLVVGPEHLLARLDEARPARLRTLDSSMLARIGTALGAASEIQAKSGRWLKLDKKSDQYLKAMHVDIRRVSAGVIRRKDIPGLKGGQITKHLGFEDFALLTPAAPAALAAMATQAALEASLDEIMKYLASIDAKLDRLLEQRKVEVRGQLGGIALAIEEANAIHGKTGKVSEVTWSKVQGNTLALQTLQVEAVAQLQALADHVKRQATSVDQAAEALDEAAKDVPFWLEVLARTLVMQDRQYLLELARVEDLEPGQLAAHREGIVDARDQRTARITTSLAAIVIAVRDSRTLSNIDRVVNPINAPKFITLANDVSQAVAQFAERADLEIVGVDEQELLAWSEAAKTLLGDAAGHVGAAGAGVASKVKRFGAHLREHRESSTFARAEKIVKRRGISTRAAQGTTEIEPAAGAD